MRAALPNRQTGVATHVFSRSEELQEAQTPPESARGSASSLELGQDLVKVSVSPFKPASFALATREDGVHESPLPSPSLHPSISFGSSDGARESGSTILHADSLASCAQHVPPRRSGSRRASLDVTQVSELLGCSTAHVYDLCERSELPHYRDLQNAIQVRLPGAWQRAWARVIKGDDVEPLSILTRP